MFTLSLTIKCQGGSEPEVKNKDDLHQTKLPFVSGGRKGGQDRNLDPANA